MFLSKREPSVIDGCMIYPEDQSIPLIGQLPVLDVRGFALESALLVEAKNALAPCINAENCRGVIDYELITGLRAPVILAASMPLGWLLSITGCSDPESAVQYLLTQSSVPQPTSEKCVLCYRYEQTKAIISARKTCLMNYERSPIDHMKDDVYIDRVKAIQSFVCPIDTNDGYRSEWCLKPQPYDPFFYPVVDPPLIIYNTRYLPCGAAKIMQTAMIYDPVPLLKPDPGERICKFISRASNTDGYDHSKHALIKKSRVSLLTLNFFGLRDSWCQDWRRWSLSSNFTPIVNETGQINKEQLRYVVNNPENDEYHLHACSLWDSFMDSDTPDFSKITSSATFLPQWHSTVNNLSYWTSLSEVNDDVIHQLSKSGLKQRCQTRNAKDMLTKRMISRTLSKNVFVYNGNLFFMCKDLLLCTLLGNYRDRSRPLTSEQRHEFIRFFASGKSRRWVMNLFLHCPIVLTVCIRDFVADQWKHRPALSEVIADIITPSEYVSANNKSIEEIREVILQHYQSEWDRLPDQQCSLSRMWVCGAKDCTMPCKHTLLLPKKLRNLRQKKHTTDEQIDQAFEIMDPQIDEDVEWTRPNEFQSTHEDQIAENDANWTWTPALIHQQLNKINSIDKDGYQRPFLMSRAIFRSSKEPEYERLDLVRYDPTHLNCLNEAAADLSGNTECVQLFNDYKKRQINLQDARKKWNDLPDQTRAIVRQIDWNIQDQSKRPRILELSRELGLLQLNAINAYHRQEDGSSMVGALHYCVVYCRTCNKIKTSVDCRQHGLRGIKVSFVTLELCCSKCDSVLFWYNMLGRIFVINHVPHCLCSKCGFFVSNPVMREELICINCANPKTPQIESTWRKNAKAGECAVSHCNRNRSNAVAGRSCLTDASAHYITDYVYLCSRHYDDKVLKLLKDEDIVDSINKMFKKRKRAPE